MNIIESLIVPFGTEYYYELEFSKEKYNTLLKNSMASDNGYFEGSLYSWGFNYKNTIPILTMNYKDRFQGELRGEYIEKNKELYLKITVISVNRIQMFLIPIITTLFITMMLKNILFSIIWCMFSFLISYENNRMMVLRGNQMLKSMEELLELKKKVTKEVVN